ncbi:hypothetical protein CKA32_003700 [Geitlerinema sp. FC II]|nr:hypothetical protein CKA32_003700 [Geitlerinema sp. FC II]
MSPRLRSDSTLRLRSALRFGFRMNLCSFVRSSYFKVRQWRFE